MSTVRTVIVRTVTVRTVTVRGNTVRGNTVRGNTVRTIAACSISGERSPRAGQARAFSGWLDPQTARLTKELGFPKSAVTAKSAGTRSAGTRSAGTRGGSVVLAAVRPRAEVRLEIVGPFDVSLGIRSTRAGQLL